MSLYFKIIFYLFLSLRFTYGTSNEAPRHGGDYSNNDVSVTLQQEEYISGIEGATYLSAAYELNAMAKVKLFYFIHIIPNHCDHTALVCIFD